LGFKGEQQLVAEIPGTTIIGIARFGQTVARIRSN
jgi:hypothetical protein